MRHDSSFSSHDSSHGGAESVAAQSVCAIFAIFAIPARMRVCALRASAFFLSRTYRNHTQMEKMANHGIQRLVSIGFFCCVTQEVVMQMANHWRCV